MHLWVPHLHQDIEARGGSEAVEAELLSSPAEAPSFQWHSTEQHITSFVILRDPLATQVVDGSNCNDWMRDEGLMHSKHHAQHHNAHIIGFIVIHLRVIVGKRDHSLG